MGRIKLDTIRCYAFHGCMVEEERVGQLFEVDVELHTDLTSSSHSDSIADTIDYVSVTRLVKQEMAIRSKLIEHVAGRILRALTSDFPVLEDACVTVRKINPPTGGDVKWVSVTVSLR